MSGLLCDHVLDRRWVIFCVFDREWVYAIAASGQRDAEEESLVYFRVA